MVWTTPTRHTASPSFHTPLRLRSTALIHARTMWWLVVLLCSSRSMESCTCRRASRPRPVVFRRQCKSPQSAHRVRLCAAHLTPFRRDGAAARLRHACRPSSSSARQTQTRGVELLPKLNMIKRKYTALRAPQSSLPQHPTHSAACCRLLLYPLQPNAMFFTRA